MNTGAYRESLKISIEASTDPLTNPDNLECMWYGCWNVILTYWLSSKFVISPQYTLIYSVENSDGNKSVRHVIPDFVAIRYKRGNYGYMDKRVYLLVENKRSVSKNELSDAIESTVKQLDNQVSTLFLNTSCKSVYGIVTVGSSWKMYTYERVANNPDVPRIPKSSWNSNDYGGKDDEVNYKVIDQSSVYDLLSNDRDQWLGMMATKMMSLNV